MVGTETPGYYDFLGVPRDADAEEIKRAYRKMALIHHPDKGGDTELFKQCTLACETLSDATARAAYDRSLLRSRSSDGRGSYARSRSTERPAPTSARRSTAGGSQPPGGTARERAGSTGGVRGPVEIPQDPSTLSVRELKDLLTSLGVRHDDCVEKVDLLERLSDRRRSKQAPSGDVRGGPRTTSPAGPAPRTTSPAGQTAPRAGGKTTGKPLRGVCRTKIISIGPSGSGKSCLIKRYCEGRFVSRYITTIGVDYGVKEMQSCGRQVKVNFFDLAGGEDFEPIRTQFYENTCGALLVYDVTQSAGFRQLSDWVKELKAHNVEIRKNGSVFFALCANKVDMPNRQVNERDGRSFAEEHGMQYFETSASSGAGVSDAMQWLADHCVRRVLDLRRKYALDG